LTKDTVVEFRIMAKQGYQLFRKYPCLFNIWCHARIKIGKNTRR